MLPYLLTLLTISSFSTDVIHHSNSSISINYDKTANTNDKKSIMEIVHNMYESQEKYSFINGSNKPSCRFKVSISIKPQYKFI